MKKLLSIAVAWLLLIGNVRAQLSVTILDTLHTYYDDVQLAGSGSSIVSLTTNYELHTRSYNGNDFGVIQSNTTLTGYYEKLQVAGDFVYAVGYNIQAIDISIPSSPVVYPESFFTNGFRATDHWNNLLLSLSNIDGITYRLEVFTLFYPSSPQRVDTIILPADGDMKVAGNKLYYFWSDTAAGDRIRIYSLSNTAPYLSLTDSFVINHSTNLSLPSLDVTENQLLAKTSDSLFHFRINAGGNLHLLSKKPRLLHVFNMVAADTNTVCYANSGNIHVHQLHSDVLTKIDSLSGFAYFNAMGRLGNNLYYSGGGRTTLIRINNDATKIGSITTARDQFSICPNPASDHLLVNSSTDGIFHLYSVEGKLLHRIIIKAGNHKHTDLSLLSPGMYLYTVVFDDGSIKSGKLIKKE